MDIIEVKIQELIHLHYYNYVKIIWEDYVFVHGFQAYYAYLSCLYRLDNYYNRTSYEHGCRYIMDMWNQWLSQCFEVHALNLCFKWCSYCYCIWMFISIYNIRECMYYCMCCICAMLRESGSRHFNGTFNSAD